MPELMLTVILLPLFGCFFALISPKDQLNAYKVTIFTVLMGIFTTLRLFAEIDVTDMTLQKITQFNWLDSADGALFFGVDAFSLILILGIYLAMLIGLIGLNSQSRHNKMLMFLALYFTFNINAFLAAGDTISFYLFFAGMLLPLFMLVCSYGNTKKNVLFYRFFIYNFVGILSLLIGVLTIYRIYHGNIAISDISPAYMRGNRGIFIWCSICLAFISRIPVWPFHYWISSVSSSIKNPLVYIIVSLMPLTGLYGFIRFQLISAPNAILPYFPFIGTFGILTMVFIALIGLANKEFLYKLFSYSTVYYLLFLLAIILPPTTLTMNIAYSFFIFLIVISSLVTLEMQLEEKCAKLETNYCGILAYMPCCSKTISFFILTAIGLPISSLFWNNFILISAIFAKSFLVGIFVMFSLIIVAAALLHELYIMRDLREHNEKICEIEDLSHTHQIFFVCIITVIFLSFFNPLWFIF